MACLTVRQQLYTLPKPAMACAGRMKAAFAENLGERLLRADLLPILRRELPPAFEEFFGATKRARTDAAPFLDPLSSQVLRFEISLGRVLDCLWATEAVGVPVHGAPNHPCEDLGMLGL